MEPIRQLSNPELIALIRNHLKGVNFVYANVWDGSICDRELESVLDVLEARDYARDALNLLNDLRVKRKSVSYLISNPLLQSSGLEEVHFEVVDTQVRGPSPHGILGHFYTYGRDGKETRQLTLEMLH